MSFLQNVRFQAFSTLLGLLVNVLTLAGIVLGVVELKPGFGPLSKPAPVITLLYLFMVLMWLVAGIWLLGVIKRRNGIGPRKKLQLENGSYQSAFIMLMYSISIPTTVLWILAWGELLGWPASGPGSQNDPRIILVPISFFTLAGGGGIAAMVATQLDWLFNLDHYSES